MSFIETSDYDSAIYSEILTSITRANPTAVASAESAAISFVRSHLNSRYDTDTIFAATGSNRSSVVLMSCLDVAIYNMHAISNPRSIPDIRVKRYDDAVSWLKGVSSGKINPDLPIVSDGSKDYIHYGGNEKRESHF